MHAPLDGFKIIRRLANRWGRFPSAGRLLAPRAVDSVRPAYHPIRGCPDGVARVAVVFMVGFDIQIDRFPVAAARIGPDARIAGCNAAFVRLSASKDIGPPNGMPLADVLTSLMQAAGRSREAAQAEAQDRIAAFVAGQGARFTVAARGDWAFDCILCPLPQGAGLLFLDDRSAEEMRDAMLSDAERLSRSGAWQLDLRSQEILVSEGAKEVFGPDAERIIGSLETWAANVHPEDRDATMAAVTRSLREFVPYTAAYRFFRTDGQETTIKAAGEIVKETSGAPRWARGIFQDVSEIRAVQQDLERSEATFRAIVESSSDTISIIDRNRRITFVSPAITTLLGLAPEEIVGSSFEELVHAEDLDAAMAAFQRAFSNPKGIERVELRLKRIDGAWREVEVIGRNYVDDPYVQGIVVNARDVSARNEAARRLVDAQKLEAIGKLTGGVAHDFNNLLAVILGNLELLREGTDTEDDLDLIDAGITATLRGADLVKKMLSFARRARLEPEVLNLNAVVRDMKNWAGRTLPANIDVETVLVADLWPIEADAALTESALLNLLLNSRDAMPGGGELSIVTANAQIYDGDVAGPHEDLVPGRYVVLAVSDTGHGIPEDQQERIFEPFFSTKPPGAGSGLGLSMVQGFMKQSGGAVYVSSEPGVGTTLKLYFRAIDGTTESTASPNRQDDRAEARGGRVLVAEDEPDVLAMLTTTLSQAGYHVRKAKSGDEALRAFQWEPTFDVVLTDIVMPGTLQGTTLAKELRKLRPELQVVFMTGYASEAAFHGNGVREEDIRLMKPVRRNDLIRAVERAMSRSKLFAEPRNTG